MSSLITSISLKNFKGFSDEVRIDLRPVTLLFGANSAGKSSVLHALQYVREILDRNNANADRTAQGGEAIDLGGFMNLVHGRTSDRQIDVAVEMALGDNSIPELVPDAFEDWQTNDEDVWNFYNTLQEIRKRVERVTVRLSVGWNSLREEPVVMGYQIDVNGTWCVRLDSSGDGRDTRMRLNRENPVFMFEASDEDALLAELDDWVSPQDLESQADAESDGTSETPNIPVPKSVKTAPITHRSALPDLLYAVRQAGLGRPGEGLRAWLTGFNGALPRLGQMLYIPAPGTRGAANIYMAREFTAFLSWLTIGPAMLLRDQLRKLRYIGPLRRVPPRSFEVSLTKSEAAWSDGMAAWETLVTGPQNLVEGCSEWMSSADKLGTGYKIERKHVQEFDITAGEPTRVGFARSRIELIDQFGLAHRAQDVGVGISQVLPVVVAALDRNASIVCIEQPELHVHPAVQVGLGDLFIDGALNGGLSFLIETHSEHLILRLLRRIREAGSTGATHATSEGALTPDVLGVYYLLNENGRVTVMSLPVNVEGDFERPWPRGFFEERGSELF